MGSEANITLRRVESDEHIVVDRLHEFPQFVAQEPVCVLPALAINLRTCVNLDVHGLEHYISNGVAELVIVGRAFGLVIVAIERIEHLGMWQKWAKSGVGPGREPFVRLSQDWARVTQGRWLVTDYSVRGGKSQWSRSKVPVGIELGTPVSWELWT